MTSTRVSIQGKKKRKEKRQAGNNNKINVSVFEMYFTAVSLRERKNNFGSEKLKNVYKCNLHSWLFLLL